jgi:hypothetical protein
MTAGILLTTCRVPARLARRPAATQTAAGVPPEPAHSHAQLLMIWSKAARSVLKASECARKVTA